MLTWGTSWEGAGRQHLPENAKEGGAVGGSESLQRARGRGRAEEPAPPAPATGPHKAAPAALRVNEPVTS